MTKLNKIPKFKNIKEEARFWDTHNITDYLNELKPAKLSFVNGAEKNERLTIRVEPSIKKEINKVADCYDISTSSLVRMWVVDKLRKTSM